MVPFGQRIVPVVQRDTRIAFRRAVGPETGWKNPWCEQAAANAGADEVRVAGAQHAAPGIGLERPRLQHRIPVAVVADAEPVAVLEIAVSLDRHRRHTPLRQLDRIGEVGRRTDVPGSHLQVRARVARRCFGHGEQHAVVVGDDRRAALVRRDVAGDALARRTRHVGESSRHRGIAVLREADGRDDTQQQPQGVSKAKRARNSQAAVLAGHGGGVRHRQFPLITECCHENDMPAEIVARDVLAGELRSNLVVRLIAATEPCLTS